MIEVHSSTSISPWVNCDHHLRQVVFVHLPVRHPDPRFRHQVVQVQLHAVDGLDAVVDEEHLPAAFDLAQDRLAHQALANTARCG